jgi:methylthioribose-1-phosphate isomerase
LEELEEDAGSLGAAKDLLANHNTKIEEIKSRKSIPTNLKAMSKLSAPLIKVRAAYAMHLCKNGN